MISLRRWTGTVSDETLAVALQKGDSTALTALFERYQEPLYRFLLRWLANPEEAEDLVGETFLRVHASIASYQQDRPFRPWIYTIAKHLAWKKLRERREERWVSMEETPELYDLLPDGGAGPEERFHRKDEGDQVRRAVEGLPEEQRMVFLLHHYQGLPYEEIAQVCECPIGTVKSRMHYALSGLRRRLAYLREGRR